MSEPLILVYGDIMLDVLVTGSCKRNCPEAPLAPVMLSDSITLRPGGAANVAANLRALGGGVVALMGGVGRDSAGASLSRLLEVDAKLAVNLLVRDAGVTTVKTRLVADGRMILRMDTEAPQPLAESEETSARHALGGVIELAGAVVISDYGKGMVTPGMARGIIAEANRHGIPVVVDSKTPEASQFEGAEVLKPNCAEIARALGCKEPRTDEEAEACARNLLDISGSFAVVLTRGAAGMCVASDRFLTPVNHLSAHPVKAVDVTGAGDTACAALALSLALGDSVAVAARFANAAAAVAVTKWGTAAPTLEEAEFFYDRSRGGRGARHASSDERRVD